MAASKSKKSKTVRYHALRPHAARIAKLAEYPLHVNGAYLDDPERIPLFESQSSKTKT